VCEELVSAPLPFWADHLLLPRYWSRAGWWFDKDALVFAMKLLDIRLGLRLRYSGGRRGVAHTSGSHRIGRKIAGRDWHRITINQDLSLEEANHTLWHELAHCSQSERWSRETGDPIFLFYRLAYRDGVSYRMKSWETHAEMIANVHGPNYSLLVVKDD